MNKILYIGIAGVLALGMSSCQDTMDTHPTEIYDESTVWGSKSTAQAFVNSTMDDVLTGMGLVGNYSCVDWEARTPNSMRCSQVGEGIDNVANELGLSSSNNWGPNRFNLLRMCNMILEKTASSTAISDADKKYLAAQGHLLRGLIFFDQARKMGRFVPVKQVFDAADSVACRIPMTKDVAESYKLVTEDLEAAVEGLPTNNSTGLPTRWAADVILSRACLQAYAYTSDATYLDKAIKAANDVINNSGISLTTSTGMFNETDQYNSEILWGYYRLSSNTTIGNIAELIRTYPNIAPDDNITSQCPYPLLNKSGYRTFEAWGIYFPTQDLVDQYLVTDAETGEALPWNETSQYKNNVENLDKGLITGKGSIDSYMRTNNDTRNMPTSQDFNDVKDGYEHFKLFAGLKPGATKNISQLMYENRDKRFYYSIIYDGCTWVGETVGLNLQGNLSQGVRDREDGGWYNTTTGYYWRKNTIESPEPRAYYSCKVNYHYNIARLGEAYMNLAEAYLLKKDIPAAVEALNKTRTIHGGLKASSATTEETAWKDYIRERTVEMTNEGGDLYFSYLRWGKYGGAANHGRQPGDVIYDLDRPVYKIEINRDRSKILVLQHTLNKSADRRFTTKRYLLPINQGFLDTREAYGLDHTQNPEW